jgi:hypothetical protein
MKQTDKRAALDAKKIRRRMEALAAKTVARGATPGEAAAASAKLAWFRDRHDAAGYPKGNWGSVPCRVAKIVVERPSPAAPVGPLTGKHHVCGICGVRRDRAYFEKRARNRRGRVTCLDCVAVATALHAAVKRKPKHREFHWKYSRDRT